MAKTDLTCLASLTSRWRNSSGKAIQTLLFFKAFGKLMEERTQEALRELEQVKDKQSMAICSALALIHAHKQCETADSESVVELPSHVRTIRRTAEESTLFYGGLFYWLIGHIDKATVYVDKVWKLSKSSEKGRILKRWLDMSSEDMDQWGNAIVYLHGGFQSSMDVVGLMAVVKYLMDKESFSQALKIVNQISHLDFLPGLPEIHLTEDLQDLHFKH